MSVKKSRILRIVTVSTLIMMLLLCFSVSVVPTSATTGDTVSSPLVVESVDEERLAFVNEICIELNSYLYDNVVYPKGSGSFGGSYIDWDSEALVIQLSDYSAVSIYEDALPGAEETVIRPLLEKVIQCGYDWADRYKDHEFIRFEAVKYSYFFFGKEKQYEAHPGETYEECKKNVERVLRAAL